MQSKGFKVAVPMMKKKMAGIKGQAKAPCATKTPEPIKK